MGIKKLQYFVKDNFKIKLNDLYVNEEFICV